MKNMIQALILAASVATLSPSVSQAQQTGQSADQAAVRNVVLVHGAFADGSGWRKVYEDLTNRGYRVTIVQNPLTSFEDDVTATRRALDRQDGPAVLVYVSALSPDAGETTAQQYDGYTTPPEFVIEKSEGSLGIPRYDSPNGRMMEAAGGVAYAGMLVRDGRRNSLYRAYVHPVADRPNLTILTDTLVRRVLLDGATATASEALHVPDHLLAHLSPLGWDHVNVTGDCIWNTASVMTGNHGGLKPLRPVPDGLLLTA